MKVPLVDLRANLLPIRDKLFREFSTILEGMQLFQGPNIQAFEKEFAAYCGAGHGISVSNGTDALFAALRACDIGPGAEVITASHTFFATVEAIVHTGATPVLVDVEPDRLTIDVNQILPAVTTATRAIVPVHLYGHPADMDPILEIADDHGLRVIEDAAQAHGARYKGRRCGSMGDAGCFSFYCTKNLGALGEGGFVTTNDGEVAEKVRLLRHHGHASKFEHATVGYNLRMDELQAAVLRLKLPRLDANNERRRQLAARYASRLQDLPIKLPASRPDCEHVHHVYAIRVDGREQLLAQLAEHGIGTGVHYKIPAHLQPALRDHPHRIGRMSVTEAACRALVSIPMYPELADEQLDHVAVHLRSFLEQKIGR